MVYVCYERCKHKLRNTQTIYESILSEKESILENQRDMEQLKLLDETIERMKKTLEDRKVLLWYKEKELAESKDLEDVIYRLRYIEHMKVKRISRIVHYSDTQVYRILQAIEKNIQTVTES